jgi:hypothetical protein
VSVDPTWQLRAPAYSDENARSLFEGQLGFREGERVRLPTVSGRRVYTIQPTQSIDGVPMFEYVPEPRYLTMLYTTRGFLLRPVPVWWNWRDLYRIPRDSLKALRRYRR